MKLALAAGLFLLVSNVFGQTVKCNDVHGEVPIPGTGLTVTCPSGGTVAPTPPPPVTQPQTGCSASQVSSSIGGKTLQRQCSATMTVWPSGTAGSGDGTDLGKALSGSWPTYNYSGYSPTFQIDAGKYIALQFTPTSSGGVQFSANPSYGDGGTISVSTQPGVMTQGGAGYVCGMNRNGTNGIYVSTTGGVCTVKIGVTYYLNLADVDVNGNFLCYNGRPNSCASSTVSYTIYAAGQ